MFEGEQVMNESMIIPMCYCYKGSTNCYVYLRKNIEDETISVITDYGETVRSGHGLAKILKDLDEHKYV